MPPPPSSQGLGGAPPPMPGLPPPPTGMGAIPTGGAGGTKKNAGDEAILKLQNLIGFIPQMQQEIQDMIAKIKAATQNAPAGPPVGAPGTPGSGQMDSGQMQDSGSAGPM